jgi:hypothetical protein
MSNLVFILIVPIPTLPDESIETELAPLLKKTIAFGEDIHTAFDSMPKEYGYVVLVPGEIINLSPAPGPPKFSTDGIATLVLPVVDKLLNIPVVQFKVPFIAPSNDVIFPEISKVIDGFIFPIDN